MTWTDTGLTIVFAGEAYHIHNLTLVLAGLLLLSLIVITVLILSPATTDLPGASCRFRRRRRDRTYPTLTKWECESCGAGAYTADKKPPKECNRQIDPFL